LAVEIERKFLITQLPPELRRFAHQRLRQGYLISAGDDLEVRLRARDGQTILTIKHGGGLTREEDERAIEPERFARLWPLTEGHRIEKVRYAIPAEEGLTIGLDAYTGALDGLAIAEVEFDSEAQAQRFTPPAWFGPEVTGDRRYANQRLADDGLPRVPAQEPGFSLGPGEPLGEGLRRLVREQIDAASDQLRGQAGSDPAEAVHEARKSFKRIRATLRLARDQLQPDVYEREIASFRDAGRRLSSARDSQVLLETLDSVCERYAKDLTASGFSATREMLVAELRAAEGRYGQNAEAAEAVLKDLCLARRRLPEWRFQHDDIAALASGFERIYRNGRRAVRAAAADQSDEHLHEVRKRTKELWHSAEILNPVAPEQTEKLILLAHRLSDLVGDDHDLAVLAEHIRQRGDRCADGTEQSSLQMLIARRRRKLQRRALRLGARLYRSRPRSLRAVVEDHAHGGS
jgi:CYTH domain-containing protein/CHAD domain-containing protein